MRTLMTVLGFVAALAFFPGLAQAQPFVTINDANASADFDLGSSAGMYNWWSDATDHMYQQWFWMSVDGGAPVSIDTLGGLLWGTADTNFDTVHDQLAVQYGGAPSHKINLVFTLRGAAPGQLLSDIMEGITITNETGTSHDYKFYQYADFDLYNDILDDSVWMTGTPTDNALQSDRGALISETIVGPNPTLTEVNTYVAPGGIPTMVTAPGYNLDGSVGPLGVAGGGARADFVWAFQWDFTLGHGSQFEISKDKMLVPAPGAVLLGAVGLGLVGWVRRRYSS